MIELVLKCFKSFFPHFQKARETRINMAKNASSAGFISAKKRAEEALLAREAGLEIEEYSKHDIFEMQHHHLLSCLERTTVQYQTFTSGVPVRVCLGCGLVFNIFKSLKTSKTNQVWRHFEMRLKWCGGGKCKSWLPFLFSFPPPL